MSRSKYKTKAGELCSWIDNLQVVDACVDAIGASKVGIKLQQGVTFSDLIEPEDDVIAQYEYLGPQLEQRKLAYVCLSNLNSEPYSRWCDKAITLLHRIEISLAHWMTHISHKNLSVMNSKLRLG